MHFYRLTLFYRHFNLGWTEVYYRRAIDAIAASNFGDHITGFLAPRATGVQIQAIRAQRVDGLRTMYLRLVSKGIGEGDPYTLPTTTQTAALVRLYFDGGGSRELYVRGLPDDAVVRSAAGAPTPHARFNADLQRMHDSILGLGLLGQEKVQSHPQEQVLEYGPFPDNPYLTQIRCDRSFRVQPGQYVELSGPITLGVQRYRGYLVIAAGEGLVVIASPWPAGLPAQWANQPAMIRQLAYTYPTLGEKQFADWTAYRTGQAHRYASWVSDAPLKVPNAPCGRVTDMLDHCYTVPMRFFRDDPLSLVRVHWYFTPEDNRKALDYEHAFGSREWELEQYEPLLGETYEGRFWSSGRELVDLEGIGQCGNAEQWAQGALTTDATKPLNVHTGHPCCCGPGRMTLPAGLVLQIALRRAFSPVPAGGVAVGGRGLVEFARAPLTLEVTAVTGVAVGGDGRFELARPNGVKTVDPIGGIAVGGPGAGVYVPNFECNICVLGRHDEYLVTIAGATGEYVSFNGTWSVTGAGCILNATVAEGYAVALQFFPSSVGAHPDVRITTAGPGGGIAVYLLPGGGCLGPWTLPRVVPTPDTWPLTVFAEGVLKPMIEFIPGEGE